MRLSFTTFLFAASTTAASALTLADGTAITVETFENGEAFDSYVGAIADGADVSLGGYRLFLNEGDGGMDFFLQSTATFCGWTCGEGDIEFRISGLDFGEPFSVVDGTSDFATGSIAVNSDTSMSFFWENDGTGTATVADQTFFSGTFSDGGDIAPIPLPAGSVLLIGGLAALVTLRRKG